MAATTSSPSKTLSSHLKRKASDDYIERWLADQQKQVSLEADPNLQSNSAGEDVLNEPSESWIPASSNASTNSGERLRSRNASKGVKRVFILHSNSTSSTASSPTASVAFKSDGPSIKRARTQRNHRDAKEPVAFTTSSAPVSGTKRTSTQNTVTIVQELQKFSIAIGNPPSDADCEVSMSSTNPSQAREWPKEAPDTSLTRCATPLDSEQCT